MAAIRGQETATQSYAQALFNVGQSQGVGAALLDESRELAATLKKQPRLAFFLESPQIGTEKKHALLDKVFKKKLNPLLLNLLRILVNRERGILLSGILAEFEEIAERADGIWPARVSAARELGADERKKIQKALEKYTHSKLKIGYDVKPDLIGGLVFRFKDILVDGSIRHHLKRLRERFENSGRLTR